MSRMKLAQVVTAAFDCLLTLSAVIGIPLQNWAQSPEPYGAAGMPFHAVSRIRSISEKGPIKQSARPNDIWYEGVENTSSKEITAVYVAYHCKAAPVVVNSPTVGLAAGLGPVSGVLPNGAVIYDALSGEHAGFEIAPGGKTWLAVGLPSRYYKCSVDIDAVLFSDGTGEGNRMHMDSIYLCRKGIYEALGKSIPLVDRIANGQATSSEVVQKLEAYRGILAVPIHAEHSPGAGAPVGNFGQSTGGPGVPGYGAPAPSPDEEWYTEAEADSMNNFYARLESELSPSSVKTVQPLEDSQFPWRPTSAKPSSVDDVARQRNVSRDRARALILSGELQQWRTALQAHLEPPKHQ